MAAIDKRGIRHQRVQNDVDSIVATCRADKQCPFKNFQFNDDVFSFELHKQNTKTLFWINVFLEEYPENTILTTSVNSTETHQCVQHYNSRLPVILEELAKKHYHQMKFLICEDSLSTPSIPVDSMTIDILPEDDDCDDSDEEEFPVEECEIPGRLARDIGEVETMFGVDAITYRNFGTIDECEVDLAVPTDALDAEVARAWRLIHLEPITVRLHFHCSQYPSGGEPTVEVFRCSVMSGAQKERTGIHFQMEKILQRFVHDNWCKVAVALSPPSCGQLSNGSASQGSDPTQRSDSTQAKKRVLEPEMEQASRLVELGFSTDQALAALNACGGFVDSAAEMLLSGEFGSGVAASGTAAQGGDAGNSKTSLAAPKKMRGKMTKSQSMPLTSTAKEVIRCKDIPSLDHGFLVQIMQYALQRLPALNEYCVICDETHIFESSSMLKPTVCSRDLCIFSFQTLGVMANAADEIATQAEVVDLLITMANAACRSARKELILDPYPSVVHPTNAKDLAFNPKKKNFELVQQTLDSFMSMEAMANAPQQELKKLMDQKHHLSYPLLQWIISSNRAHIVKLPENKQLPFMKTKHQFLMRCNPPAKEAEFNQARNQFGSTFAFHGSSIENWHSIVRRGLINASGTRLQVNGSAYGSGIYLSPHLTVSMNYSAMARSLVPFTSGVLAGASPAGQGRFLHGKTLICVALCEVVNSPKLQQKNESVWTCVEPAHVCTRFFFIYEGLGQCSLNVHTQAQDIVRQIQEAMAR